MVAGSSFVCLQTGDYCDDALPIQKTETCGMYIELFIAHNLSGVLWYQFGLASENWGQPVSMTTKWGETILEVRYQKAFKESLYILNWAQISRLASLHI